MTMNKKSTYISLLLVVAMFCVACTTSTGGAAGANKTQNIGQTPVSATGELKYKTPDGWLTEKPSSSMRVAQYKLPKVEGDSDDAGLVLYFFGSGQGGSVSDNVY